MITIKYSPYGQARSDWEAKEVVKNIKEYISNEHSPGIHISNELIVLAIRAAVKKGELRNTDICFEFKGKIFTLNDHARFLDPLPDGFCDHSEKYLTELIGI
jgi:hypothetical protein